MGKDLPAWLTKKEKKRDSLSNGRFPKQGREVVFEGDRGRGSIRDGLAPKDI